MSSIGLDEMVGNPEYNNLAKVTAEGRNAEVVSILENVSLRKAFGIGKTYSRKTEVPYQKLNTLEDVLKMKKHMQNDILAKDFL